MQIHNSPTSLKDARARADEIVMQLSRNPEFARQIRGDRADVHTNDMLSACASTCSYTCSWTSLEEEK